MDTFKLEIYTPDRCFYDGPAQSLVLPIPDGEYGVMPGHEPTVTAIEPGELRFQTAGGWQEAAVSSGFAEIMPDRTVLLVASAEHPDEIDIRRAQQARERAEERLRQKQSVQEYYRSKAALARAMARLKTGRK